MWRVLFTDGTYADINVTAVEANSEFVNGKNEEGKTVVTYRLGFVDGWYRTEDIPAIVKKPQSEIVNAGTP